MEKLFDDFIIAGEEIDELTNEGFFGIKAKELIEKRESLSNSDFQYESLRIWMEDNSDKDLTKELIKVFFVIS